MLSLHYHDLIGKIEETEGNKHLMFNVYMLEKVLDKIKETTSIKKFDDIRILIDIDDKLTGYITLKSFMILITCVIKDDLKFFLNFF